MNEREESPTLPVDDEARGLARRLMRTARSAALATNDHGSGAPFASLVSMATDLDGSPIILTSKLSAHTRLLEADERCSLLISAIGKGDPLAHPRLTLIATAQRLERASDETRKIRRRYLVQHPKAALYADFPDFSFWRLNISSASLNGGFGRAYRMEREDLVIGMTKFPDFYDLEADALEHMNNEHRDAVALYATKLCGAREGAWKLIGLDPEGMQLALGDEILRLPYDQPLTNPGDLRPALVELTKRARAQDPAA